VILVKEGSPSDEDLEGLSRRIGQSWKPLGRRLNFKEAQLTAFHKENEEYSEKAYQMLMRWKEMEGSAATHQVLNDALCHQFVGERALAEEFCYN